MHTCIPKCIKLAVKMFTFLNVLGESNLKTISIGWFWPLRFQLIHPSSKKVFFVQLKIQNIGKPLYVMPLYIIRIVLCGMHI